jgi:hypothetical protein
MPHWTNSMGSARVSSPTPSSRMTYEPLKPFQTQLRNRMVLQERNVMPL